MKIILAKGLTTSSNSLEFKAWQGNWFSVHHAERPKGNEMIYEKFDAKTERAAYRADIAAQREEDRIAAIEVDRINWAQRNGNNSGFDPYAGCEGEFDN